MRFDADRASTGRFENGPLNEARRPAPRDRYAWAPYEHHGWEFDGFLMRLLHLAGRWTLCTRDDPSLSTAQMLGKS